MKILATNKEKLTKAIKEAEGRATARTITADDIVDILSRITVPKSKLNGTIVKYDGAEHFPSTYKYLPESTHFIAKNSNGKWYITDLFRSVCPNRKTWNTHISYSPEAQEWILENASYM